VAGRKLEGTDHKLLLLEGVARTVLSHFVVVLGLKNNGRQEELFLNLLRPLLAQVGGRFDQNPALTLGPFLGKHQPRLDGFAKTDFISKNSTL
jgi:hypothetical protein